MTRGSICRLVAFFVCLGPGERLASARRAGGGVGRTSKAERDVRTMKSFIGSCAIVAACLLPATARASGGPPGDNHAHGPRRCGGTGDGAGPGAVGPSAAGPLPRLRRDRAGPSGLDQGPQEHQDEPTVPGDPRAIRIDRRPGQYRPFADRHHGLAVSRSRVPRADGGRQLRGLPRRRFDVQGPEHAAARRAQPLRPQCLLQRALQLAGGDAQGRRVSRAVPGGPDQAGGRRGGHPDAATRGRGGGRQPARRQGPEGDRAALPGPAARGRREGRPGGRGEAGRTAAGRGGPRGAAEGCLGAGRPAVREGCARTGRAGALARGSR